MARPIGITILGALVVLASVIAFLIAVAGFIVGFASLIPGVGLDTGTLLLGAILYLILSAVLGFAGFGLLRLRPWAWWLAFLTTLVVLGYTAFRMYQQPADTTLGTWLTIGVSGILFVYLLAVFRAFRRPATAPTM
ncbi:MAG TPA: hypothetical protein VIL45_08180 [Thermoplasmata archaeon]